MPRRREVPKRNILPDPKFGSQEVSKFVNVLMTGGKKSVAERILYGAFDQVAQKSGKDALEVFTLAINNLRPVVEVKSRRVGGATFQIPTPIRDERKSSMAMKWLIGYARGRNEKSMAEKLAGEIIAASKGEGSAFKKKEDVHRMAEANKAFAHFSRF